MGDGANESLGQNSIYFQMFQGLEQFKYPVGDQRIYNRNNPPENRVINSDNLEEFLPDTHVPFYVVAGKKENNNRRIYRIMAGEDENGRTIIHVQDCDERGLGYGYIGETMEPSHHWNKDNSKIDEIEAIYKPEEKYYSEQDDRPKILHGEEELDAMEVYLAGEAATIITDVIKNRDEEFSYYSPYTKRDHDMYLVWDKESQQPPSDFSQRQQEIIIMERENGDQVVIADPKPDKQIWEMYTITGKDESIRLSHFGTCDKLSISPDRVVSFFNQGKIISQVGGKLNLLYDEKIRNEVK